jgi:hypothetical protein
VFPTCVSIIDCGIEIRTWKKEHLALFDRDVTECVVLYNPEEHVAFDLVEPFLLISLVQGILLEHTSVSFTRAVSHSSFISRRSYHDSHSVHWVPPPPSG